MTSVSIFAFCQSKSAQGKSTSGYAIQHAQELARQAAPDGSYRRYTYKDYQSLKSIDRLGGLGPDRATESYQIKVWHIQYINSCKILCHYSCYLSQAEKAQKQIEYARIVNEKNRQRLAKRPNNKDP